MEAAGPLPNCTECPYCKMGWKETENGWEDSFYCLQRREYVDLTEGLRCSLKSEGIGELKNCGECSHGTEIPVQEIENGTHRFYCTKYKQKTEMCTAFTCPSWDGKGISQG